MHKSSAVHAQTHAQTEVISPNEAEMFAALSQTAPFDQFLTAELAFSCLFVCLPETILLSQHISIRMQEKLPSLQVLRASSLQVSKR